jgi:hypothetical protein
MHFCIDNKSNKMLSKITWSEFIWFIILILVPYYLYILSLYFKKEILAYIRNPVLRRGPYIEAGDHSPEVEPLHTVSSHDDISLSVIHDLLEDLKKIFAVVSKTKMVKEELVQAIQTKLKSYPGLQGSDLQEDVSNHIRIEAKTICGIALDLTDLKQLWNT